MKFCFFCLIIFFSQNLPAKDFSLVGRLGAWQFNRADTSESSSGLGAYNLEAGYNVTNKIKIVGSFNILMSDGWGGQQGFGFDLGTNYYFLSDNSSNNLQSQNSSILIRQLFRPYLGLCFRQRTFNFLISTNYIGGGVSAGLDYSLTEKTFINFEARYDVLTGPDDIRANQLNYLLGVGFEI